MSMWVFRSREPARATAPAVRCVVSGRCSGLPIRGGGTGRRGRGGFGWGRWFDCRRVRRSAGVLRRTGAPDLARGPACSDAPDDPPGDEPEEDDADRDRDRLNVLL